MTKLVLGREASRATVGRLYTAREDDDDDATGIEIAGCDAVTAAFAAIAETEHLLFSRDLIPYLLARPLLIG